MARTLKEVMDGLEPEERATIEAKAAERIQEFESLKAIRKIAGQSQAQIAEALGVKQPAVAQLEKRTDVYLSTLRDYIEAAGGRLELLVELPGAGPIRLKGLKDLSPRD